MEKLYDAETKSVSSHLNYSDEENEDDNDLFINNLWDIHKTLVTLRGNMSQQKIDAELLGEELSDLDETQLPPTYLVIQLSSDIPLSTLTWFIEKLRGKKRDGGGELIIMKQPVNPEGSLVIHVSATKIKLLEAAEEMELVKKDKSGALREFTVQSLEDFLPEGMHVDDLFSLAERQTITKHEIDNIRALSEDSHIPGFPEHHLYLGQSIIQICEETKIIKSIYPLHDPEVLKKLGTSWYMSFSTTQPFFDIKNYFGEAVTLYFHFLDFYTQSLFIPVVLIGILHLFVSSKTVPFFCIFNVIWVTLLLELWRRKSNELAYQWGTIGMTSLDEPRPNFRGAMGVDAVTGKVQPQAPRYLTYVKMYAVSIPIVFVCLIGAFIIMLISFWAEDYAKQSPEWEAFVMLPSIIYSVIVLVLNASYRSLATYLTEWENHRTQSQYERHRVTKLVLFEFVNNFMALFYIAFITKDMEMLKSQLQTMLIINQVINNLQETIQPLLIKYYMMKVHKLKLDVFDKKSTSKTPKVFRDEKYSTKKEDLLSCIILPELDEDDPRIKQAIDEGDMEPYEGTYDDYCELFVQFGYVFLFSSIYPFAAFWALLNNIVEIRADAFKFCKVFQRPICRRVKDIGAWQRAFEILGALSIISNCGLLYMSPEIRSPDSSLTDAQWLLIFVILEHALLGVRFLLHIVISDKPEWVRVGLAKRAHEAKQALKFERSQRNRRILTRRFKTVHGPHTD